jgi:LAO/AO transport system kinase
VLQLSALKGSGLDAFWQAVTAFHAPRLANGQVAQRRQAQEEAWMWERVLAGLRQRFHEHAAVHAALPGIVEQVRAGQMAASVAARRLLDLLD